jgi:hypothetical protein
MKRVRRRLLAMPSRDGKMFPQDGKAMARSGKRFWAGDDGKRYFGTIYRRNSSGALLVHALLTDDRNNHGSRSSPC